MSTEKGSKINQLLQTQPIGESLAKKKEIHTITSVAKWLMLPLSTKTLEITGVLKTSSMRDDCHFW